MNIEVLLTEIREKILLFTIDHNKEPGIIILWHDYRGYFTQLNLKGIGDIESKFEPDRIFNIPIHYTPKEGIIEVY